MKPLPFLLILLLTLLSNRLSYSQAIDINGGFENGIFSGGISFAGGTAQDLNAGYESVNPTFHNLPFAPWQSGWYQPDLNAAYWVESSAALDGSHYLYLSGKDVCYNLAYGSTWGSSAHLNDLVVGQTYQYCFWAAAASSTDQSMGLEWTSIGSPTETTLFTLAGNAAWSDTSLSVIPWQQYCYTFTATSANGVITMSTDLNSSTAVVLDGATLVAVPEPGSVLLCGSLGLLCLARRRRPRA